MGDVSRLKVITCVAYFIAHLSVSAFSILSGCLCACVQDWINMRNSAEAVDSL